MPRPPKSCFTQFVSKPVEKKTATYARYNTQGNGGMGVKSGFVPLKSEVSKTKRPRSNTTPADADGAKKESGGFEFLPVPDFAALTPFTERNERNVSNNPLHSWLNERETFLAEEIRREGRRGVVDTSCPRCLDSESIPRYRCKECEGDEILCKDCIVEMHRLNGLHFIEFWNGDFFEYTTLKEAGLRFQLNHRIGESCPHPVTPHKDDFVVIHTNGVHEVGLNFCGCYNAPERFVQVLRHGWFPATTGLPKTAATQAVLRQFHLLSFESKCSVFEFYQALTRLTDNTGIRPIRDRYRAFLNMVREHRHLKTLKRARRGHDPAGAIGTGKGECAVLCSACPQPGLNLPTGWEKLSLEKGWKYRLFLAIDANFRLKRRAISSEAADPSLNKGWAYFVEQEAYSKHLATHASDVQPKSTCSSHSAVNNSRLTDGLSASGVGAVICARHDCMRPHSVGDLQKGERYANMDYLFLSGLSPNCPLHTVTSYDIACQWCRNLLERVKTYSEDLRSNEGKLKSITYLVPKFHLPAHVGSCQTQFSFNFAPYVGRTDGEAPERGWSHINPIASSTAEMGPGSRRDTVDGHFGDWNWKKNSQMGTSLWKRIQLAVVESAEQMFRFHQFELGLRKKMPKAVKRWEKEIRAWECDPTRTNPFESRIKRPTQEAVRRELAEEDQQEQSTGKAYAFHVTYSGSELIAVGLELEEQQRRVSAEFQALGAKATDDLKAKALSRANGLRRRIDQWITVQERYIPGTNMLRQDETAPANSIKDSWQIPLFLPSSLPASTPCDTRLLLIEWRLRTAQAHTALDELRRGLRLRSFLYIDKDRFSRGQRQNTRSQTLIERAQGKVDAAASKYRNARGAIAHLAPSLEEVEWEKEFPVLDRDDIRALPVKLNRDVEKERKKKKSAKESESEGRRKVSWIWGVLGESEMTEVDESTMINDDLKDDLRVEWCKSRARAMRWQEEVVLLREEMRRVLVFLEAQNLEWISRSGFTSTVHDEIQDEGYRAYALEQAAIQRERKEMFEEMWKDVDRFIFHQGNLGSEGKTYDVKGDRIET